MILHGFCWYDKVDKVYMRDSVTIDRSTRAVCRGYLQTFEQNRKMNYKEFSLCHIFDFDDETGVVVPVSPIEEIDPTIVFDKPETTEDNKPVDL